MEGYTINTPIAKLRATISSWEKQPSIVYETRLCKVVWVEDIKGCAKLELLISTVINLSGKVKLIDKSSPPVYITTLNTSVVHTEFEIENKELIEVMKNLDESFYKAVEIAQRPVHNKSPTLKNPQKRLQLCSLFSYN